MASFPTAIKSYTAVAAGNALPYDVVQSLQDEVTAIETSLISAVARAQAFNSTTQSLTNNTLTAVTFDSEDYDVGAMHSTATNTSRFTVPTGLGGLYHVIAKISFAANATGVRQSRIRKNGADITTGSSDPATAAGITIVETNARLVLAAGDYIEVWAFQDSGGSLNIGSATRSLACELSMARMW